MRWFEKLPSAGFVAIVLTNVLVVAFLAWGFRTPKLHRVWELHHELKIGMQGKLKRGDYQLLDEAMAQHAELSHSLLSDGEDIGLVSANSTGWLETPDATIIRTRAAGEHCAMVLEVKIPENALPLEIKVSGRYWEKQVSLEKQGSTKVPLAELKSDAEIITLKVTSKDSREEVATLGLRVTFECSGKKAGVGRD